MNFWSKVYRYIISEFRLHYFMLFVIFFITSILEILVTGISKSFIDGITNNTGVYTIYYTGIIFFITIIILLIFQLAKKYLSVYNAERILSKRRLQIYKSILNSKEDNSVDGVHRMLVELPKLIDFCITTIPTLIFDCMSIIILIFLLFKLNFKFLFVVFAMIALNLITFKVTNRKLYERNQLALNVFTDVTSTFYENVNSVEFINAMNIEHYSINRLYDVLERGVKARFKVRDIQMIITSITTIVTFLPQLFILIFGSVNVLNNKWSLGDMIIYITYMQYLVSKINNIANINMDLQNMKIIMQNYTNYYDSEFNNYEETIIDGESINEICVNKVNLPYNDLELNMKLKKGDFLYIKGSNGSGKTTFIYNLLKLKKLHGGEIRINNKPIESFKYSINGKSIGVVLQKTYLFNTTVKENIDCGRMLSNELIVSLYESIFGINIDEKFLNRNISSLSGGEKRKIEVIRAIIGKPDIIILDEVETYLDDISFNNLTEFLYKSYKDTIVIMVAHRPLKKDERVKILDFDAVQTAL